MEHDPPYIPPFLRRIMPSATEAELEEASENLRAYLMLLYRIFLRKEAELAHGDSPQPESGARFGNDGETLSPL